MQKAKHIVIVAGEESGDAHAACLAKQIKTHYPEIILSGIGGKHMSKAGVELIFDLAAYGVTGFVEVVRHAILIITAFKKIKHHLHQNKPDLLILVDYPGFNLRLARYVKLKLGIPIIYYISPQIWAWKAKRIHLIKKCVDHMAVILPFEKELYQKEGVNASFVGHPLINKIKHVAGKDQQRQALNLPRDIPIVALLPGSRNNEIERHMPILHDTATNLHQLYPNLQFIIPIASSIEQSKIKSYAARSSIPFIYVSDQALNCMAAADFVIVASGTASLECALLKKPMCIIYKTSYLSYLIAARFIKVKFVGLCNLLSKKMIVPEFLQEDCNSSELVKYVAQYFARSAIFDEMIENLSLLNSNLSNEQSDRSLLNVVEHVLFTNTPSF